MTASNGRWIRLLLAGLGVFFLSVVVASGAAETSASEGDGIDYLVLATSKTSTMEKELNESADVGYRFRDVMGGETSFGGSEVVVVMSKPADAVVEPRFKYKLLATNKTSTMQKELQEAGDAGFYAVGQTVFSSAFGGDETVIILERDSVQTEISFYEYRLLATNKTGTMQKELSEAGSEGYDLVGLTVSKTAFGGTEVVSIMRRKRDQ